MTSGEMGWSGSGGIDDSDRLVDSGRSRCAGTSSIVESSDCGEIEVELSLLSLSFVELELELELESVDGLEGEVLVVLESGSGSGPGSMSSGDVSVESGRVGRSGMLRQWVKRSRHLSGPQVTTVDSDSC